MRILGKDSRLWSLTRRKPPGSPTQVPGPYDPWHKHTVFLRKAPAHHILRFLEIPRRTRNDFMCSSRASERDKRLNQSSPSAWNLAETTLSF